MAIFPSNDLLRCTIGATLHPFSRILKNPAKNTPVAFAQMDWRGRIKLYSSASKSECLLSMPTTGRKLFEWQVLDETRSAEPLGKIKANRWKKAFKLFAFQEWTILDAVGQPALLFKPDKKDSFQKKFLDWFLQIYNPRLQYNVWTPSGQPVARLWMQRKWWKTVYDLSFEPEASDPDRKRVMALWIAMMY